MAKKTAFLGVKDDNDSLRLLKLKRSLHNFSKKYHPMTIDEVVQMLNANLSTPLSSLQELVLRGAWEGKTYTQMANEAFYGAEHLRKIGSELWGLLSDFSGHPIHKSNFRESLEQQPLTRSQQRLIDHLQHLQTSVTPLEFPSGPVPLDSNFYIPRPPIEELAYAQLSEPGSVIRIKAPQKMGKSSLILRILECANSYGYRSVLIDLQQADKEVFTSLDKFLRWLCINISRELHLEILLNEYWDSDLGSKVSCTIYFQAYLLKQIQGGLVIALSEVNRLFEYPEIAADFLPLLRVWHEQSKQQEIWRKLRLVVAYSGEKYVQLKLHQSPLNVGLSLDLPPFNLAQVLDLAQRHGLNWTSDAESHDFAVQLSEFVGGHPYLVRLSLYHICRGNTTLKSLLDSTNLEAGIYREHLRHIFNFLRNKPELGAAIKNLIMAGGTLSLDPLIAEQLNRVGLVKIQGDKVTIICELYRRYFTTIDFNSHDFSENSIQKLKQKKKVLQNFLTLDTLTELPNRTYFDSYLEIKWQQLISTKEPLSVLLCNLDFFKIYNEAFGAMRGNECLRQVAQSIRENLLYQADLVARYGGDEFAAILCSFDGDNSIWIAEKIREKVKALAIAHDPERIIGLSPFITVSIGIASTLPQSQDDPQQLICAALEALAESKRCGGDRVTLSSTFNFTLGKS